MSKDKEQTVSEETPVDAAEAQVVNDSAQAADPSQAAGDAAAAAEQVPLDHDAYSALLAKLDAAQAEAKDMRETALRKQAELDNFRKRMAREREDLRKYAASDCIESLLPVIDNMALGLKAAQDHHPEAKGILDGFGMVLTQLRQALKEQGVDELNPVGEAFDPNFHESMADKPDSEIPEGHVVDVIRIGYRLHERLLRPATVVVSSGAPNAADSSEA